MIHQLDIYGKDKVENAIEMLRFFEPTLAGKIAAASRNWRTLPA